VNDADKDRTDHTGQAQNREGQFPGFPVVKALLFSPLYTPQQ